MGLTNAYVQWTLAAAHFLVFSFCTAEEKMLSTKTSKSIRVKFTRMNLLRFFLIVRFPPV